MNLKTKTCATCGDPSTSAITGAHNHTYHFCDYCFGEHATIIEFNRIHAETAENCDCYVCEDRPRR